MANPWEEVNGSNDLPPWEEVKRKGIPPVPQPPTLAEGLSKMAMPPVPKSDALSPTNIVKAAGENLLPPGIAFKNGLPVLSMDSLKRGMAPMAGQYGLSGTLEALGGKFGSAALAAGEGAMVDNPLARNYPTINAAVMTPPAIALDAVAGGLKPSSMQQMVGAEGAGMAAKLAVAPVVKGLAGKYGKVVHGIDEGATKQALKNTEILDNDFATPTKIEEITRGIKTALDDTRKKISSMYDALKIKLDKANKGKGKVPFSEVTQPINEARTKLKVGESGLTKIDAAEEARVQQLGKEVSQEINNKVLKDFVDGKGKLPFSKDFKKFDKKGFQKALDSGKFTAEDMLEIRKRISREIDFEGLTDLYKKELLGLRGIVDDAIRDKYPALKELDAKTAGIKKAEATIARKTGIRAGKQLNEVNEEKVSRVTNWLFKQDRSSLKKAVEEAMGKVGATRTMEQLKDVAASQQFNTTKDALTTTFGSVNPKKILKGLFKMGLEGTSKTNALLKKIKFSTTGGSQLNRIQKKDEK